MSDISALRLPELFTATSDAYPEALTDQLESGQSINSSQLCSLMRTSAFL